MHTTNVLYSIYYCNSQSSHTREIKQTADALLPLLAYVCKIGLLLRATANSSQRFLMNVIKFDVLCCGAQRVHRPAAWPSV